MDNSLPITNHAFRACACVVVSQKNAPQMNPVMATTQQLGIQPDLVSQINTPPAVFSFEHESGSSCPTYGAPPQDPGCCVTNLVDARGDGVGLHMLSQGENVFIVCRQSCLHLELQQDILGQYSDLANTSTLCVYHAHWRLFAQLFFGRVYCCLMPG